MAEDWIAYIAKHRIHATTLIVVLLIAWRAIVGAQHSDALSVGLHHSFIGLALVIGEPGPLVRYEKTWDSLPQGLTRLSETHCTSVRS